MRMWRWLKRWFVKQAPAPELAVAATEPEAVPALPQVRPMTVTPLPPQPPPEARVVVVVQATRGPARAMMVRGFGVREV